MTLLHLLLLLTSRIPAYMEQLNRFIGKDELGFSTMSIKVMFIAAAPAPILSALLSTLKFHSCDSCFVGATLILVATALASYLLSPSSFPKFCTIMAAQPCISAQPRLHSHKIISPHSHYRTVMIIAAQPCISALGTIMQL